jgi:hypothetical protein
VGGGHRASLLDDNGPRWHQWIVGPRPFHDPPSPGAIFGYSAEQNSVLELGHGLASGFVFRVEMRQDQNPQGGFSGVYVGRSSHRTRQEIYHCCLAVTAVDRGLHVDGGAGSPNVSVHVRACQETYPNGWLTPKAVAMPKVMAAPVGGWRLFEVEVGLETIEVRVDGVKLTNIGRVRLGAYSADFGMMQRIGVNALTPTFAPHEGFGVFASACTISVKRASVEPLPG